MVKKEAINRIEDLVIELGGVYDCMELVLTEAIAIQEQIATPETAKIVNCWHANTQQIKRITESLEGIYMELHLESKP